MVSDTDKKDAMEIVSSVRSQKSFTRANSSFFQAEHYAKSKKGNIINCISSLIKDPNQIRYIEDSFRREVGPEFGFDMNEIHKHFQHRRSLRSQHRILR
jgi:hypothetical protein